MHEKPTIVVEFYGVPRQRAGVAEMTVQAVTVREMVDIVKRECPNLRDFIDDNADSKRIIMSLNGDQFVTDFGQELRSGDRVILLTPDVGG